MSVEPRDNPVRFTPRQSAIVANALAFLALAALVLLVGAMLFFGLRFVAHYSEVLLPPVAAVILAKVVQTALQRRIDELEHGAGSLFEDAGSGKVARQDGADPQGGDPSRLVLPSWVRNLK